MTTVAEPARTMRITAHSRYFGAPAVARMTTGSRADLERRNAPQNADTDTGHDARRGGRGDLKPTSKQFVAELREMGLGSSERSRCMETFHDAGVDEAREQARTIVARNAASIRDAENVMRVILG